MMSLLLSLDERQDKGFYKSSFPHPDEARRHDGDFLI